MFFFFFFFLEHKLIRAKDLIKDPPAYEASVDDLKSHSQLGKLDVDPLVEYNDLITKLNKLYDVIQQENINLKQENFELKQEIIKLKQG